MEIVRDWTGCIWCWIWYHVHCGSVLSHRDCLSCGGMLCCLLVHSLSGCEDRQQVPVVNSLSTQHDVPEEDGSLRRDHRQNLKAHVEMNLLPRPCSAVLQGQASNVVTASSSQVQYSAPNGVTMNTSTVQYP